MLLHFGGTRIAKIDWCKFGLPLVVFLVVSRLDKLFFFFHFFRCRENKINNSVNLREFLRHQNLANFVHYFGVIQLFFETHETKQTVNADKPDVPRMTRTTNLRLKIAGVTSPDNDQDGAVGFLGPTLTNEFSPICRNGFQIDAIGICRFRAIP